MARVEHVPDIDHKTLGRIAQMQPWDFWTLNHLIGLRADETFASLSPERRADAEVRLIEQCRKLRDADVNVPRPS